MNAKKPADGVVRYAVVGAGWFGQEAVLPAFARATSNSKLTAIISGDPTKREELSKKYGVPAHPYSEMDSVFANAVDAVYIVTPNTEHREPTEAAARHGVHVLCEKPLAQSTVAAKAMVETCTAAGVKLMTAYRLHFEKASITAIERIHSGQFGTPRLLIATNTQLIVDKDNIRLDPARGGHPLLDLGVYCVNAARYLFRDEPLEVIAYDAGRMGDHNGGVPDLVCAILKFSGHRLAQITCGFGQAKVSHFQMVGTQGDLQLTHAFSFTGDKTMISTIEEKSSEETFSSGDQMAAEIEYFSDCILNDKNPEPDGDEGLIDMRIMEAILTSIRDGRAIPLSPVAKMERPEERQVIQKRASRKPKLVNAMPPTE